MAVTLPNILLRAKKRSHEWVRDARGVPMPSAQDTITETPTYPCSALEKGEAWEMRLDPRMDPLRQGDELVEYADDPRVWTITSVPIFHKNPYSSAVDHVAATAVLNDPVTP